MKFTEEFIEFSEEEVGFSEKADVCTVDPLSMRFEFVSEAGGAKGKMIFLVYPEMNP